MDYIVFISLFAIVNIILLSLYFISRPLLLNNKHFAFLVFSIICNIFSFLFLYLKMFNFFWYTYISFYLILATSPLLFFTTIQKLLYGNNILTDKRMYIVNRIAFTVALGCIILFYVQNTGFKHEVFLKIKAGEYPIYFRFLDFLFLIQAVFYIVISYVKIYVAKKNDPTNLKLKVLHRFINYLVLAYVVNYSVFFLTAYKQNSLSLITISVSVLLLYFYCCIQLLKYPNLFLKNEEKKLTENQKVLSAEIIEKINVSINKLIFEEQIYKQDIDFGVFAERCNVPKYILNQFLNQRYQKSFPDFINQFRVLEARKLLVDANWKKYNIDVVAQTCGFNSRSSFYSVFKKHTGITPMQFTKITDKPLINDNTLSIDSGAFDGMLINC